MVCQCEGKDARDRRLVADVTRRVGCALRKMRAAKIVRGERDRSGAAIWSGKKKKKKKDRCQYPFHCRDTGCASAASLPSDIARHSRCGGCLRAKPFRPHRPKYGRRYGDACRFRRDAGARKTTFGLVRAGLVVAIGLFVIDALRQIAGVQRVPASLRRHERLSRPMRSPMSRATAPRDLNTKGTSCRCARGR